MASPSNHGMLCHSSAIGIDSGEESEDSKFDDSSDEDEEEGGDGGGPPSRMLCRGVANFENKEPRSNPSVDVSLKRSHCLSVF